MARAEVPEGCAGLDFPDGSKAHARELGGVVPVSDRQAAYIKYVGGDVKIVGARFANSEQAKQRGPWVDCASCPRTFLRSSANPEETRCPRCRGN